MSNFVLKSSENSRQYLLLRTDNLQKTVVGCPWFENSAWTNECFHMCLLFLKHGWCMFRPQLFSDLHAYFLRLNFQFLSLTGVVRRFEMLYLLFVHLFSCRSTFHRELVFTLSVQWNREAGRRFYWSTVKEELYEYGRSVERLEVLIALLCNGSRTRPNHPGGIANI